MVRDLSKNLTSGSAENKTKQNKGQGVPTKSDHR